MVNGHGGGAARLDEQRSAGEQVADHWLQSPTCVQIRSGTGTHKRLPFMTPANNAIQTFMASSRQNIVFFFREGSDRDSSQRVFLVFVPGGLFIFWNKSIYSALNNRSNTADSIRRWTRQFSGL